MGKLTVFNFITLNGYFEGQKGDIGWHKHGAEEGEYSAEMLRLRNTLLLGRVTYEMMASYWPSPMAAESFPEVAAGMNSAEKVVFSKTLKKADWKNSRIVKDNIEEEIRKMKKIPGKDMTVLGSGSIVARLAEAGLIDEYQIMVDPVAIGSGTPLFRGIRHTLDLKLTGTRTFRSGAVLLFYRPDSK